MCTLGCDGCHCLEANSCEGGGGRDKGCVNCISSHTVMLYIHMHMHMHVYACERTEVRPGVEHGYPHYSQVGNVQLSCKTDTTHHMDWLASLTPPYLATKPGEMIA